MIAAILPVVVGRPTRARVVGPATHHPPGAGVLDRRGGPRTEGSIVDRFTAATHRPLPLAFAVGARGHWAVMTGVSVSPHGILVRALDPEEASLEAPERDVVAAWRRMATLVGLRASPLWYSSAAINARAFVAELAAAAARGPVAIELVVLDDGHLGGRRMHGMLAPLADPTPAVLGVFLEPEHREALAAAYAPTPSRQSVPAVSAEIWPRCEGQEEPIAHVPHDSGPPTATASEPTRRRRRRRR